ncbi:DUF4397 domain-containing protein [Pseudomonadota bacterium]|uniref:DUF4397 domain-containing protein n=1 Tax=unclassified Shewanella TaxID=196818 RepID=UPI000CB2DEA3|nr:MULTISPECIES: DUF4397 domain-containing protein [unclassified Shewanella]MDO6617955.1 DUF4397 domain-containing protein [Shewanella sp. 6_MG-2023]MDO6639919.1 DUF4397 domain-containing protein [Shewanella sp. 5_MG-2023]PMG28119.1 hypothetical protein BCU94_03680 [Shewanella sp. 10N.286.52.C2]PMH86933.1 hypothetical protein BCU57_08975 [Shewanella sp. 10N.286.48.B5]
MKRKYSLGLCFSLIALTACSDDDDDKIVIEETPNIEYAQVRVIHASSDAPMVNVTADGAQLLADVDYAVSSGLLEVEASTYAITVDAKLADGTTTTVLSADLAAAADMEYTAVALGNVSDENLMLKLVANEKADITADNARVQVLHAAPDVGLVDIYVTEPMADIAMMEPTLSANYMDNSDQLEVPTADYQIRITPNGDKTVVFDSGTVNLAAGNDYFISAIPNEWSGDSPVALLVALPDAQVLLNDVSSGSDIRVVHAVADAPAVDVFLDGSMTPAIDMLSFGQFAGYVNIPEGMHTVTVAADADNSVEVIKDAEVDLMLGASYSVLAVGSLSDNDISPWAFAEHTRRIATEARLNVIHASYSAGNVDVYLTPTADISASEPALTDVPFKAASGSLSVAPGDYTVSVTVTGTKTVAIGPLPVSLAANGLYSVAAVDAENDTSMFSVILMDDFVAEEE